MRPSRTVSPRSSSAPTSEVAPETLDHSRLDEIVSEFAAEHRCPTIVWAAASGHRVLARGSFGEMSGTSPDGSTAYRIASMTKSFSAAATLSLRDDGSLALDDRIGDLVPSLACLRAPTDDAADITVRDLLGMSSGLVTDDAWADRHLDLTDDEFDRSIRLGPVFARSTGDGFEYSNFGFAVLGRVIREVTGTSLQDLVRSRILEPLELHETSWTLPDGRLHAPPVRSDGSTPELPTLGDGAIAPMGGLWSSVKDLLVWIRWLADAFPARNGPEDGPLRRSSRREMQQALRYSGRRTLRGIGVAASYGFGLHVLDDPIHGCVIGHSGGLPGYGSNMRWTPGGGVALVALSNRTYAPMAELNARLHDHLADAFEIGDHGSTVDPSDEFSDLVDRLAAVLTDWSCGVEVDHSELARVFADNVEPDESFVDRSETLRQIGPLGFGVPDHPGRAGATLRSVTADGTAVEAEFTVAPVRPLRVQHLDIRLGHAT
ncbi:MAG: serine hydrolase domain-containing protein [Ilumatobacteraceae bacterium]